MTPKDRGTKKVSRERHAIYWDKAMDFLEVMVDAAERRNWNGVGLAGVHACISAADAVLVKHAGLRSGSQAHQDVVDLLRAHINHPDAEKQARRLSQVIAEKNLIEYVDKSYTEKEAAVLKTNVERFIEWARKHV